MVAADLRTLVLAIKLDGSIDLQYHEALRAVLADIIGQTATVPSSEVRMGIHAIGGAVAAKSWEALATLSLAPATERAGTLQAVARAVLDGTLTKRLSEKGFGQLKATAVRSRTTGVHVDPSLAALQRPSGVVAAKKR